MWNTRAEDILSAVPLAGEPLKLYVNSGLAQSGGYLEVKVRIDANTLFVIQVQGHKYCRCVEFGGGGYERHIEDIRNHQLLSKLFSFLEDVSPEVPYIDDAKPYTKDRKNGKNKNLKYGFCQYGNGAFVYQYVKIAPETKVEDIITAVYHDITNLTQQLS